MIIRKDTEEKRVYEIPGIDHDLPSVTTILSLKDKPALVQWASNMATEFFKDNLLDKILNNEITIEEVRAIDNKELIKEAKLYHKKKKEEAADIGTKVHEFISEFLLAIKENKENVEIEVDHEIDKPVKAFFEWWHNNRVKPIEVELPVWSLDAGGYAGTLDAVLDLSGKIYVVDFKTSKAVYDDHELQIAAYHNAYLENINPTGCSKKHKDDDYSMGILRLDKETGYPFFHPFDDPEERLDLYEEFKHWTAIYHRRDVRNEKRKAIRAEERKRIRELKKKQKEELKQYKEDPF